MSCSPDQKHGTMSTETFVRELEVESASKTLKIHQCPVGDVGVVVWDAGIALGKYLDHMGRESPVLADKNVLELGSGTGIVGLVAAALGANTTLTDLPELVPLLQKNIEVNKPVLEGSAIAKPFRWGEELKLSNFPDLILASDCVYYEESVGDLLGSLFNLSDSKTELLISYEERTSQDKEEILDNFLSILGEEFVVKEVPSCDQNPLFQSPDIHILKCKRKLICTGIQSV